MKFGVCIMPLKVSSNMTNAKSCKMGVTLVPCNLGSEIMHNNSFSVNMQGDSISVEQYIAAVSAVLGLMTVTNETL
jgi:hypothetical protein